ncbi:MAG: hypothetical protein R2695_14715 [Acidimicrobiales bacterium]
MHLTFGTDGMRGDARTVLTAPVVAALGRAGAELLGGGEFAVGRDPGNRAWRWPQPCTVGSRLPGGTPSISVSCPLPRSPAGVRTITWPAP